jgi:hypothetical protein
MYLPIPAFPDLAENIAESRDPELCENPVNEEDERQIGNDKIVSKNYVQVQIMQHNSSFLRVIIHGRFSMS